MQVEYTRSKTSIDTGAFLQIWNNYTYVSSYDIFSTFLQADFLDVYYTDPIFSTAMISMRLQLSRTDEINTVVFDKIGTPIAQFVSILNILMLVGIVASMVSEAQIFEKFIDVYFKSYYRTTAAEFITEKLELLEKAK
jgi:hypothetical protein